MAIFQLVDFLSLADTLGQCSTGATASISCKVPIDNAGLVPDLSPPRLPLPPLVRRSPSRRQDGFRCYFFCPSLQDLTSQSLIMASLPLVSDKIIIDSLVLPLTISLDHWSRPQPSPHSLTLTISTPPLTAEASQDDLGSTSINYSTSSKAVVALAQSRSWESLEGCAEAIAACVLEMGGDQGVKSVRVEIGALKVLAGGKARIVISRGRQGEADASPDVMELEGVEVRCIIGLNPQERLEKQSVVVALSIPLPRPSSSSSSAESAPLPPFPHKLFGNAIHEVSLPSSIPFLSWSITYVLVRAGRAQALDLVRGLLIRSLLALFLLSFQFVGASSYQTIESLAQALCDDLLSLPLPAAYSPLPSITVRVSKPYAITFAKYASVEITRSLGGLQSPAANAPSASSPRREPDISGQGEEHVAYLAMGSNMGDRLGHIKSALKQLDECGSSRVVETSFLYESEPMYVEDQAKFMNGAVKVRITSHPFGQSRRTCLLIASHALPCLFPPSSLNPSTCPFARRSFRLPPHSPRFLSFPFSNRLNPPLAVQRRSGTAPASSTSTFSFTTTPSWTARLPSLRGGSGCRTSRSRSESLCCDR
jgi:dihydroneopterin aldolase